MLHVVKSLRFDTREKTFILERMRFVADLQIHSKYSRATSKRMEIETLVKWAKIKGIAVVGTGDFTHPDWFKELKQKLAPSEPGLFVWKDDKEPKEKRARFMLTAETSHIYTKNGKVRRVHILIWAPSFEAVEKINTRLSWVGNLRSDGRPIIGMDSKALTKIVMEASEECMVIPAHIFTPWFSVFGSMSGFDSLEECFEELTPHIHAVETGLSSNPAMNWRLSQLDNVALVSNSDSHSPERIGREANAFDTELSYQGVTNAIKSRDPKKFLYTIEFFPEEGKYHYDGHRACGVCWSPEETKRHKGICEKCGKPVVVGVAARVEALADRPAGFEPREKIPFRSTVPLDEIITEAMGVASKTKTVYQTYHQLCAALGGEIPLVLEADIDAIKSVGGPKIAEAIRRVREGKLVIRPGFDGEYGKIKIFESNEKLEIGQTSLF